MLSEKERTILRDIAPEVDVAPALRGERAVESGLGAPPRTPLLLVVAFWTAVLVVIAGWVVEGLALLAGIGAVWLLWRYLGPTWELFSAWLLTWVLIPISVIDAREQIIPDELSIGGLIIALGISFLPGGLTPQEAALAALAGGGTLWAIAAAYLKLRGHEGMGTGDFKLLAMIGAFVGLKATLLAVMVASVVGSVLGGGYLLLSRSGSRTPIPFGPFLALGGFLALLFPDEIVQTYLRLVGSLL